MVSGYNAPGSSTWHIDQHCSGVSFSASEAIDSNAAEHRGLSPCGNCVDGEWPHEDEGSEEETSDRDPDEWVDKIKAGETALKFQARSWNGPEYVGKREEEGQLLRWPLGIDYNVSDTTQKQVVGDLEDPDIDVEAVDFSETPLAEDDDE